MSAAGAGCSVELERAGVAVVGTPGSLEAEGRAAARRDHRVVSGIRGGDRVSALVDGRAPRAGDVLIAGEGEAERPAVDAAATGVGDGDVAGEAALPLRLHVRHPAAGATATRGGAVAGRGRGLARRAGGVADAAVHAVGEAVHGETGAVDPGLEAGLHAGDVPGVLRIPAV